MSALNRALIYSFLLVFAFLYLIPLYVLLATSLKSVEEMRLGNIMQWPTLLDFSGWEKAWGSACIGVLCDGMKGYFWNSILITVPAVLLSTFLGAFNGYVLTKWKFKGANWLFGLMLFGCFIPFQAVLIPAATVLGKIGLAGSLWGLILVHIAYGLGFTTLFFRNYYHAFPPELVHSGLIDGAGFFRIFRYILLPNSTPIFVITIIWQFTNVWNDFLFGASFSSGTNFPITVALNNLANSTTGAKEYNVDMAAAIFSGLPTLLVYIVASKYFIRGLLAGSVKG